MPEKISKNKKSDKRKTTPPKWFYLVLILIPILFFVLLEVLLKVIDYGNEYKLFIPRSPENPDKLYLNPEVPHKYFYGLENVPFVIPDGFDKVKSENAFRVFVLGGSSTAGYPYVPNASFARHIKRRLELLYPENKIEVINCGMSAVNSYTINDIVPGILTHQPDLILIYAGHNEYYGALGVASSVSVGQSRFLVGTYLWLQNFRTTQLIQNIISGAYSLFRINHNDDEINNETLMSRMVGESLIPFESDLYFAGLDQFEGNLNDILSKIKDKNIPVIIGTLTSNLKDMDPFVSVESENEITAKEIFKIARNELKKGNKEKAKELFIKAKDLDALRFRAPEKINEIILNTGKQFDYYVVKIDSIFNSSSPDNITGNNLIVDHLHPDLDGYKLIAKTFFNKMNETGILPDGFKNKLSATKQDSILNLTFPFTKLDSTIAELKIIILTGSYPFVPTGTPNKKMNEFSPKDNVDSLALDVVKGKITWTNAHYNLANYYYQKENYAGFIKNMTAIIEEKPFHENFYKHTVGNLVEANLITEALYFLRRLHKINKSYYTYKWLGQILLSKQRYKEGLKYLKEASNYNEADSQLWYNLAGAYYYTGNYKLALIAAERSVELDPDNQQAKQFYNQLKQIN